MAQPRIINIVLDVLKPHQPSLPEFAAFLSLYDKIDRVDVTVEEIDEMTESLRVVVKGDVDYEGFRAHMASKGAVIHSVDQVVVEQSIRDQGTNDGLEVDRE